MNNKTLILFFAFGCSFLNGFGQQGLKGEYYDGNNFEKKITTRTDRKIDFSWKNESPAEGMNPNNFSIRWTGKIKAPKTGEYLFRADVDDGIRVKIDGQSVIDAWGLNDEGKFAGTITLQEGQLYDLKVDYFNGLVEGEIKLYWQLPGEEPAFGGFFGYNDKIIGASYFYQPTDAPPAPEKEKPAAKPVKAPAAKPDPKPKPTPSKVKPAPPPFVLKDSIEHYKPKNILFEQSKNTMLAGSTAELDQLAGFLNRHPKLKITIEGHTDKPGNPQKNLELSQIRTDRVVTYLTNKGVDAQRLKAIGYGSTRPLIKSEESNPKNRRVVFLIGE